MTLRAKFWVAFALIASLAAALAAYGVHALSTTRDLIVALYDEPLMGVNYARRASATMNEARRLMDRMMFSEAGASPAGLAALEAMENDIGEDLRIVRDRVRDPSIANSLHRAEESIAEWFRDGRMIVLPQPGGLTALRLPTIIARRGKAAISQLDDVVELVVADGFTYRARAESTLHASSVTLASLGGGIIMVGALFVLMLAQFLIRPIRAATRVAEDVAADAPCDVVTTRRRDEIGRLLNCLATMQVNLRDRDTRTRALMIEKDQTAEVLRQINLRFDTALNYMSQGLIMWDREGVPLMPHAALSA